MLQVPVVALQCFARCRRSATAGRDTIHRFVVSHEKVRGRYGASIPIQLATISSVERRIVLEIRL